MLAACVLTQTAALLTVWAASVFWRYVSREERGGGVFLPGKQTASWMCGYACVCAFIDLSLVLQ